MLPPQKGKYFEKTSAGVFDVAEGVDVSNKVSLFHMELASRWRVSVRGQVMRLSHVIAKVQKESQKLRWVDRVVIFASHSQARHDLLNLCLARPSINKVLTNTQPNQRLDRRLNKK